MRFIQKRPSGKDKDIPVFEFAFGHQELQLILGLCRNTKKNLPEILETNPMRQRLNNIIKVLQKTYDEYHEKKN